MQWVSHCPFFPQYQLEGDATLVESLGKDISKIEVYEMRLARWIPAPLTHTFTLTTGCHVFIRRHGVTQCKDFDDLYKASTESVRSPHMRSNMKGERDGVRAKLKKRHVTVTPDSESDVEIVGDSSVTVVATDKGKRRRERSPSDDVDVSVHSRPRFSPPDSDIEFIDCREFIDRRAESMSPTPPYAMSLSPTPSIPRPLSAAPSSSSISSATPAVMLSAPSINPVRVPMYDADNKREVWPHGMYTVDMAAAFRQLDDPTFRDVLRQDELFECIFGVPYVKATYHQNHRAWINAVPTLREMHEHAGYTSQGLWKHFKKANKSRHWQAKSK